MKKSFALNYDWKYVDSFKEEFIEDGFEIEELESVSLPHSVAKTPPNYFDHTKLNKVVTYFKKINIPKKYAGNRVLLNFEGVLSYCEVYVNGIFVASHKGESPFSADISVAIKLDCDSLIVVKVDSNVRSDVPSFGLNGPMLSYGGIFRPISLELQNAETIKDIFIKCENVLTEEKTLSVDVELSDFYPDTVLKARVLDGGDAEVGVLPEKAVLRPQTTIKGVIRDAVLWNCENPVIYTLEISLVKGQKTLDKRRINFGFRQAVFTRGGFFLNGKKLKLIGLNRFDSFAYFGRSASGELQRRDAQIMKNELGCNVVRTHGIPHKDFVDECDKIGLMIMTDFSGDGYFGKNEWREAVLETTTNLVRTFRNNPSIIAWGTRINNSADYDELYFKTAKEAKDLDPTRQTFGARNFMGSRLYEDVFAYNDYSAKKRGLSKLKSTGSLFVPYIVSEHTGKQYPTMPYGEQSDKTIQALHHLKILDDTFRSDKICGAIGMSFSDFHSAPHKGSGDSQSYYGVCDIYRELKPAAYAYKSQLAKEPVLKLTVSDLNPDEMLNSEVVILTNCDKVRLTRNGVEVGEFYPNKKRFKSLPHPPVMIPTRALSTLKSNNALTQRLLVYLQERAYKRGGVFALSRLQKTMFNILARLMKIDKEELARKFSENSLNAQSPTEYVFEGIIGDEVVKKQTIFKKPERRLDIVPTKGTIRFGKEHEAMCVTVRMLDEFLNILPYFTLPLRVTSENGLVTVLDQDYIMMRGGLCSFYLVTSGKSGKDVIRVECDGKVASFELEVEHDRVEEL